MKRKIASSKSIDAYLLSIKWIIREAIADALNRESKGDLSKLSKGITNILKQELQKAKENEDI